MSIVSSAKAAPKNDVFLHFFSVSNSFLSFSSSVNTITTQLDVRLAERCWERQSERVYRSEGNGD